MDKKKISIAVGIVVIIILGFVYMQSAEKSSVKIGAVLPLTGGLAAVGEEIKNGMDLAIKESGLTLVIQDGEASPPKSLAAARQLADVDQVTVILTAFRGASLSIASGLQDKDTIIVANTATTKGMVVSTSTPNLFVIGDEVVRSAAVLGEYAKKGGMCKNPGAISEQTEVGKSKIMGFGEGLGDVEVVFTELFDPNTTDFKTIIAKAKAANVDCLFAEVRSNATPILLKQLDENKFFPQVFSTSYSVTPAIIGQASKTQLDNLTISSTLLNKDNKNTKEFFEAYKQEYGKEATGWGATGYEMIKLIEKPLKKCGTDAVCIKKELNAVMGVESALGTLTMSNQEVQLNQFDIFDIVDGAFIKVQ
ncbi:MAG: hypothetical protein ACD_81C00210G0004 [uncultured bacterium]|uniref:Extracellular ligand-binding receptor n=1 Tax=Candidatus Wolfebacteria bacterium GW2011_GWC2_39_22 TaxID=1619013 RepID=A0A0G0NA00_9BACT|nr:MAG: hypothetical protein ACD_81C00210G0004 [uncultured bacterium]KKR12283.1 MAG: Extracellular ligand-binding receptor [Candidatus Wolfebacteria bacterium GW2011_GWC2_39_22]HBI25914.1 hypothetical protein [Candidatus Wolfebacteria bacterium]